MADELSTKLVFTGDSAGAEKASADAAAGVSKLVAQVQAGDVAVARLDKELRALSPEKLQAVGTALEHSIGNAKGGEGVDEFRKRLEQVRGIQAEHAAAGSVSHSGSGIEHLKESFVELAGEIPGVSGAMSGFGAVAGAVGAGPLAVLGVGLTVVGAGLEAAKRGVEEFSETEVANTKLDQALAQSGQLTDEFREKLQGMSGELQEATGIADERWAAVEARLVQFGSTKDVIDEHIEAVKNLAGIMGGDIEGASRVFSKAINGNFGQLGRLGIQVDKTAIQHEKLDSVMAQLAQRGGGQLEVQTRTIHGRFVTLENATADLFKGLGNLISRTGVLQAGLELAGKAMSFFAGLFPTTVKEVEGLTNKLPPLKDEFGRVRGAADEAGEGMDDMGDSAAGSATGLDAAGTAAGKAKTKFEEAAEAAKKLREQQDTLASAQLQLKLAQIDADETSGRISKSTAARQRVDARAGEETAAIGRKVAEQNAIIAGGRRDQMISHTAAADSASKRDQADTEFSKQAATAGLPRDLADQVAAHSERWGEDLFAGAAKDHRKSATTARADIEAIQSGNVELSPEDTREMISQREQAAAAADAQAEALEKLSAAYTKLRQARADADTSAKKDNDTQADVETKIGDAYKAKQALGVDARTLSIKTSTELTKVANEAEKTRIEDQKKLRDELLKTLDTALKTDAELRKLAETQGKTEGTSGAAPPLSAAQLRARGLLTPEQRASAERQRAALTGANAAGEDRLEDLEHTGDKRLRAQRRFNRSNEDAERFGQTVGASGTGGEIITLGERARSLVGQAGPGAPGSVSQAAIRNIQQLVARVEKEGGTNQSTDVALARALDSFTGTVAGRLLDAASKQELANLARKIATLESQLKNGR